jgi:peptidoglycan/xylan/chitin deacetylase (PgdA/CDA1 family)
LSFSKGTAIKTGPIGRDLKALCMTLPLVTIVMYHYVRVVPRAAGSRFFALDPVAFRGQLGYLLRHYSPVRLADVVAAAGGRGTLPSHPVVLTFDDGYREHYETVFPLLIEHGVPAAFFPVRSALVDRHVLDVNKVQFILGAVPDPAALVGTIEDAIRAAGGTAAALASYRAAWWSASRFDEPQIAYIKQMLQHALPDAIRSPLVDRLFRRHVTLDEADFAEALYLTRDQARTMREAGMEFGGHGDRHIPLTVLARDDKETEIDGALATLDEVGVPRSGFFYCYVKGAHDAVSVDLLQTRGCAAALTTREDIARAEKDDLLTLPRIDTNCFPVDENSPPNSWTARVHSAR